MQRFLFLFGLEAFPRILSDVEEKTDTNVKETSETQSKGIRRTRAIYHHLGRLSIRDTVSLIHLLPLRSRRHANGSGFRRKHGTKKTNVKMQ